MIGKLLCWLKGKHQWRRNRKGETPGKICKRCGLHEVVRSRLAIKLAVFDDAEGRN